MQQHTPSASTSAASAPADPPSTPSANTSLQRQTSTNHQPTNHAKRPPLFTRLPKCDANSSVSLVFQFIFDNTNHPNSLEKCKEILAGKKANASLIAKSLSLATKLLENMTDASILDKRKVLRSLEFLLTFLSCFFSNSSNNSSASRSQAVRLFPATLQFRLVHYMQNLYGCGLEEESHVRNGYYKLVNLLLSVEVKFRSYISSDRLANNLLERLHLRLNAFLVNFLDMDWELYDWKFVSESNIVGYLMRNSISTMPIVSYTNEAGQSGSDVLEEAFSLDRDEFVKKFNKKQGISKTAKY